jgi:glycosyltransferase involved in cell wall biosynthesis
MSQDEKDAPASVDVAIACYQYGRFLRGCVMGVLTQDIRDLRVWIIDNASTENTLEVAQQLAAEDPRVEVVARRREVKS